MKKLIFIIAIFTASIGFSQNEKYSDEYVSTEVFLNTFPMVDHPFTYFKGSLDPSFNYEVCISVTWNYNTSSELMFMNLFVNGVPLTTNISMNSSVGVVRQDELKGIVQPDSAGHIELTSKFAKSNASGAPLRVYSVNYTITRIEQ